MVRINVIYSQILSLHLCVVKWEYDLLDKMNFLFKNIKWWLRWMIFPIQCLGLNKRDFVTD